MDAASAKLDLLKVIELFERHRVEYLVIGGQAAILHGSPRLTFDTDLCYRRTPENFERLTRALSEIHPTLRGGPPDVPFTFDTRTLVDTWNFTFTTDLGPLDLLGWVEPLGTYDELIPRAEVYDVGVAKVATIGLHDLITIKKHIRRPKDREGLAELEAIAKLRQGKK